MAASAQEPPLLPGSAEQPAEGWHSYGSPFGRQRAVSQALVLTRKAEKRIRKTSED